MSDGIALAQFGRRHFITGGIGLASLFLAGCVSIERGVTKKYPDPKLQIPAGVRTMYGAVSVRASRIELIPSQFWRQDVDDPTGQAPGSVVVDTEARFLYHVKGNGQATRYGVGIGRAGFEWSGKAHIAYKREWPKWTPPSDMIARQPDLKKYRNGMAAGPDNPLGPRTLYIHKGNVDTLYRIHGNSDERTIGEAVSSGCVRMLPQEIIHLYNEVRTGSALLVV